MQPDTAKAAQIEMQPDTAKAAPLIWALWRKIQACLGLDRYSNGCSEVTGMPHNQYNPAASFDRWMQLIQRPYCENY
jgi:hypothetical protein